MNWLFMRNLINSDRRLIINHYSVCCSDLEPAFARLFSTDRLSGFQEALRRQLLRESQRWIIISDGKLKLSKNGCHKDRHVLVDSRQANISGYQQDTY
jgi:hypothetical protein